MVTLTLEQDEVLDGVKTWLNSQCSTCKKNKSCECKVLTKIKTEVAEVMVCPQYKESEVAVYCTIGGYAGTGKTTIIKKLIKSISLTSSKYTDRYRIVSVAAFTGKAASVLRKKGVANASTIHSLIYEYDKKLDKFFKVPCLTADVIIIDEASMVSSTIFRDLCSFKIPIIFVGDMGQLPPVGRGEDDPRLMADLDYKLTTIHRQNEQSGIISLASAFRKNLPEDDWTEEEGVVLGTIQTFKDSTSKMRSMGGDIDQVISGTHHWRDKINGAVLRALKSRGQRETTNGIEVGDRLICLQNNPQVNVFNGLIAEVLEVSEVSSTEYKAKLRDEDGCLYHKVIIDKATVGQDVEKKQRISEEARRRRYENKKLTFWDYGWCITCHKAQGSEWDTILVYEDYPGNTIARWRYTAATRAAKKLIYCYK